jgi:hypothetical protein
LIVGVRSISQLVIVSFKVKMITGSCVNLISGFDDVWALMLMMLTLGAWESAETGKGVVSSEVAILNWVTTADVLIPQNFKFKLDFKVPKDFGTPGAIIVKNRHVHEFLLQAFAIQTPDGKVTSFVTESWVYNTNLHGGRIFFSNQVNHSIGTIN